MNQTAALLHIQLLDTQKSFVIFWSILLAFLTVAFIVGAIFSPISIYFMTSFPGYIWASITSYILLKDDFPYFIHLGATRIGFVLNSSFYLMALALLMAFLQASLYFSLLVLAAMSPAEINIAVIPSLLGLEPTFLNILWTDFTLMVFLMLSLFFIASLNYRFGKSASYLFFAFVAFLFLIPASREFIFTFLIEMTTSLLQFAWLLLVGIMFAILSAITLSRVSLK